MGRCPYEACEDCPLSGHLEECHFWSPIQHTCCLSSKYEENETEDLYLDHMRRSRKLSREQKWTMNDFKEAIAEMKSLKDGWLDGDGEAISEEVIALVNDEVLKKFSFCPPHVFPMESGGLSLEWFQKADFAATVEPSLKGTMFGLEGRDFTCQKMDWTLESSWISLQKQIQSIREDK